MKRRLAIVFALVLLALFVRRQLTYPRAWDDIHVGMTRTEVYSLVSSPGQDWGEIKGAFWVEEKLTGTQELWIYFEKDRVVNMSITRRIGTAHSYYVQHLRHESIHSP